MSGHKQSLKALMATYIPLGKRSSPVTTPVLSSSSAWRKSRWEFASVGNRKAVLGSMQLSFLRSLHGKVRNRLQKPLFPLFHQPLTGGPDFDAIKLSAQAVMEVRAVQGQERGGVHRESAD